MEIPYKLKVIAIYSVFPEAPKFSTPTNGDTLQTEHQILIEISSLKPLLARTKLGRIQTELVLLGHNLDKFLSTQLLY